MIGMSLHIHTAIYNYFLKTPLIYILAAGIPHARRGGRRGGPV